MPLTRTETRMWNRDKPEPLPPADDREINERYQRGEGRIVIETNREKLPGFVAAAKDSNYLDLRPFYQRRPRWKPRKQSLLIESFLMNIPVPPIFLYERDFNSYEVMDGQQRITAILDFYANNLKLTGLEMWPELNGRTYSTLPDKLQAGIDRRSISSIVLLKESTADEQEAFELRETVFERLNTGGVALERQEIRNALYHGHFNDLLHRLSQLDEFRSVWGIPRYVPDEVDRNSRVLRNTLFSKMEDLEIILRFFALRHADHYRRGMQGFLDIFMTKTAEFNDEDIAQLEQLYTTTLNVAVALYGELAFRPYNPDKQKWENKPHKAFHDAVMIGLSDFYDKFGVMLKHQNQIVEGTIRLFVNNAPGVFTGRGNTKKDIQDRISLYKKMLADILD